MYEPIPGESPLEGLEGVGGSGMTRRRSEGQAAAKAAASGGDPDKVSFKKRTGKHTPCDECIAAMVAGGPWHTPNSSVYIMTEGGEETYLCFSHANDERAKHGLKALNRSA